MATSQQDLCDVCMSQHITQTAIICCPECEENFCEKCKVHHEFAKATKKHEVISIENILKLPKFVQDIKMNCSQHYERFVLYCDTHEEPCCTQCLHDAHAGCRNLTSFRKVIQNVKESSLFVDLETTLSDLMTNITNIIEDRTANLDDLDEQKKRCKKEIKIVRDAINVYIDELEADLLENVQKTFTEKEIGIQNMLDDFQLRKSNVCEMQENVNTVKKIATEFQSFMAIRELAQSANTAETDLHHFLENGSLSWIEICYTPTNLDSVKDDLTSIGETEVKVDPSRIQFKVRKSREAQLIGPVKNSRNIESIHLKEKFRSKLPKGNDDFEILDCGFLLDGNLIFSDKKSNRLIIMDSECVFVRNLELHFHPKRFAVIDEENIAVTTGDQVNIVDLKRGLLVKTLIKGIKAGSILLTDDKNLMVEIFGGGYTMIDLNGHVIKRITIGFSDKFYHTPECIHDRLYYVDVPNEILCCCDFDGNQIWKYEKKLFEFHSAFTSDKSNILFCSSFNSNNVYVVSTDGKSCKEIVKSNVYLNKAVAADYNVDKKELLIVTVNGNFILYDVI